MQEVPRHYPITQQHYDGLKIFVEWSIANKRLKENCMSTEWLVKEAGLHPYDAIVVAADMRDEIAHGFE